MERFDEDIHSLHSRGSRLWIIIVVFLFLLTLRLFYLQVIKGDYYFHLSEQISIRELRIPASRGFIFDRHGQLLAGSRDQFQIVAVPQYVSNIKNVAQSLQQLANLDITEVIEKIKLGKKAAPFRNIILKRNADYQTVSKIKQYQRPDYDRQTPYDLSGIEVYKRPIRYYVHDKAFSHVLGYLSEINSATLQQRNKKYANRYLKGDLIGVNGLEFTYDLELKGIDGFDAKVVDARGREVRDDADLNRLALRYKKIPEKGSDIITTLDFSSQMAAVKAMQNKIGAVVALHVSSGEVLVLYSSPGYESEKLINRVDSKYWNYINKHADRLLFDRSIQATYPPASVYKVVASFAGLDVNAITPKTRYNCKGGLKFGSRLFKCWKTSGHGMVNLTQALAQSCDVFFYHLGLKLGVDRLKEYALKLGYNIKTGIDLPFEKSGLIPSKQWKQKRYDQPWIKSETLSVVIGQGYNLATPLQQAQMMAIIANGGFEIKPHIKKVFSENNAVLLKRIISNTIVTQLKKGLEAVVHGNGTAKLLRNSPNKIAGKTGTAQVVGHSSKVVRSKKTRNHAWFAGYAPHHQPEIAVAAIVEHGGSGGAIAGPVVQAVIDAYFNSKAGN